MTIGLNFKREWAPVVKGRKGLMVSEKGLHTVLKYKDPGYSSVYWFSPDDADTITRSGASRGLNHFAVGADCLVFDIDSGQEGLAAVEAQIRGLEYEVWESGGKGFHVVLPHEWAYSKDLPYSHAQLAAKLLRTSITAVDRTLYQHGRLLSLPGRVHPVTKKRKQLLRRQEGVQIKVDLVPTPAPVYKLEAEVQTNDLYEALLQAVDLVEIEPVLGSRHMAIWTASMRLARAGVPIETTQGLMEAVTTTWTNPKTHTELVAAVLKAYQTAKSG